ncbi:alpha-L-rhamnosidase C-terminal domain-containing protein [Acidicapsa dinghuensis]|uniref:Alpha-L-rhamnosidase C-terminal domain-containing protein n=1 Tax=Acidicapsa dinghuensis TaxID=2218256 RepID=A0ABW1ENA8_9BACT|nr:alpha-L-rhamnosidase C-terminal domain-containing protein [Acidicapsa dinghuensis]
MHNSNRHIWLRLVLLSVFTASIGLSASDLFAQVEAPAPREHWTAQWISHPTAPLREPITLHFKKTFEVNQTPQHYIVHVSADNRFVLYLNGQRVGDGPARGDLSHWRYEDFDLAPMLKSGSNTLAAIVWNFGIYAPVAQMTERTGFLVQGDTDAEAAVNTNSSWMVEREPGQTPLSRKQNGLWVYFASGPGEVLRAASYDWDWKNPDVIGSHWVHAISALRENIYQGSGVAASRGVTADVPWQLVPDTLPHMAYVKEDAGHVVRTALPQAQSFPAQAVTIPAKTDVHILLDRSELTTAYPRLTFSGGNGSKITLIYAEALFDAKMHKGNRNEVGDRKAVGITDEIYPDGGDHRVFETLWWRTWRYLDIEVQTTDEPLTLDGLDAYYSAYPFDVKASFASSDPDLEKIWKIGWHTAQLDAHETYMDTPYYEQLQYSGDTRIQEMISYAVTGDDRLARQAIRALNDSRIPAGITASRYPSQLPQYIPPFSLLWIDSLHDYYMNRPDASFVKEILPGTRSVLEWFASYQHPDGLLGKTPWWTFIDWVETKKDFPSYDSKGETCLVTMQYIGALEDAIDLETALGSSAYAGIDKERLASAKRGVLNGCWDAKMGLFADSPAKDTFSQHTNMLAVLHDVAPKKDQQAILHKIIGSEIGDTAPPVPNLITASYYFRYYLARALDHAGMANEYLKTLGDWRGFLKLGFTTWPEQPGETRSDSHAWTAHPTYDLLALVTGIQPSSPGFKTVRIEPHLGDLTHLEATYPHPLGLIHVKYEVDGGQLHADIEIPSGLTGEFVWKGKSTRLAGGKASFNLK